MANNWTLRNFPKLQRTPSPKAARIQWLVDRQQNGPALCFNGMYRGRVTLASALPVRVTEAALAIARQFNFSISPMLFPFYLLSWGVIPEALLNKSPACNSWSFKVHLGEPDLTELVSTVVLWNWLKWDLGAVSIADWLAIRHYHSWYIVLTCCGGAKVTSRFCWWNGRHWLVHIFKLLRDRGKAVIKRIIKWDGDC